EGGGWGRAGDRVGDGPAAGGGAVAGGLGRSRAAPPGGADGPPAASRRLVRAAGAAAGDPIPATGPAPGGTGAALPASRRPQTIVGDRLRAAGAGRRRRGAGAGAAPDGADADARGLLRVPSAPAVRRRVRPPARTVWAALDGDDHLLVTGGPGQGKSTLSLRLAADIAQAWAAPGSEAAQLAEPVVPLRVTARALATRLDLPFAEALAGTVRSEGGGVPGGGAAPGGGGGAGGGRRGVAAGGGAGRGGRQRAGGPLGRRAGGVGGRPRLAVPAGGDDAAARGRRAGAVAARRHRPLRAAALRRGGVAPVRHEVVRRGGRGDRAAVRAADP